MFRYSTLRREAIEAVRKGGKVYCIAGDHWVLYRLKRVDHVDPVVPVTGFDGDWSALIDRMFYGRLQVLCKEHHQAKTKEENSERRRHKREQAAARNEPQGHSGSEEA